MDYSIRPANEGDLEAINAIFNHYVLTSTCTWQEEPMPIHERRSWWNDKGGRYPVLVATSQERVLGYATAGQFRPRSGYRFTAEDSIYLADDARGAGLGKALLAVLLDELRERQFHTVVASMSDDQEPSLRLHQALGFVKVAHFRETGFKFGRWLGSVFMQKML